MKFILTCVFIFAFTLYARAAESALANDVLGEGDEMRSRLESIVEAAVMSEAKPDMEEEEEAMKMDNER